MKLRNIYELLKVKKEEMYEAGSQTVEFTQDEFFELSLVVYYMMQIKRITDDM